MKRSRTASRASSSTRSACRRRIRRMSTRCRSFPSGTPRLRRRRQRGRARRGRETSGASSSTPGTRVFPNREARLPAIDLDPSEGNPWEWVREIALVVRSVLDELGLRLSENLGSDRAAQSWRPIRAGASVPSRSALREGRRQRRSSAASATSAWRRRPGAWRATGRVRRLRQNARDAEIACAYSVRPTPDARVSAPSMGRSRRCRAGGLTVETMRAASRRATRRGHVAPRASLRSRFQQSGSTRVTARLSQSSPPAHRTFKSYPYVAACGRAPSCR